MMTEFVTEHSAGNGCFNVRGKATAVERWQRIMLSAVLLGAWLAAQAGAAGVGTTGAAFLKVGIGARPLAMGSAYVALADDANAMNWNPGALGELKRRNVTASYNSLFQDENQGFLGYASPLANNMGVAGVGVNYLTITNIAKRAGDTENPDSTFSNQNFALMGSYARAGLVEGLSLGGNLKYIREALDSFSGNSIALDAGALYHTKIENLTVGGMLQNLGTNIGSDPLPLMLKAGAAYKMFNQRLALASDFDWLAMDKRTYLDLGAEFWAHKALALRAGYQFNRAQDRLSSGFTGFGIGMGLKLEQFNLDYAFLPFGNLGNTHRITLGWAF